RVGRRPALSALVLVDLLLGIWLLLLQGVKHACQVRRERRIAQDLMLLSGTYEIALERLEETAPHLVLLLEAHALHANSPSPRSLGLNHRPVRPSPAESPTSADPATVSRFPMRMSVVLAGGLER